MTKQWSLKSVFEKHNYSKIDKVDIHNNFAMWIIKQFADKKLSIVDVGGGNGRVVLSIYNSIGKYACLDINQWNINCGSQFFQDDEKIRFLLYDIEKQRWQESCDLVYIDSVLTMLENPLKVLDDLMFITDFIFVNRTRLSHNTSKDSYTWAGMNKSSILWSFDKTTLQTFCEERDFTFEIIDDVSFLIKRQLV